MTADSWSLNTRRRSEQSDQTRSRIKEDILTEEGSYFVYGQGDYHWVSVSFLRVRWYYAGALTNLEESEQDEGDIDDAACAT
jgi:hypothetical protein